MRTEILVKSETENLTRTKKGNFSSRTETQPNFSRPLYLIQERKGSNHLGICLGIYLRTIPKKRSSLLYLFATVNKFSHQLFDKERRSFANVSLSPPRVFLNQCFPKTGPRTIYGPQKFTNWCVEIYFERKIGPYVVAIC